MGTTVLLIVGAYTLFCNGVLVGMVVTECDNHDKTFTEVWNDKVNESQDKKLGRICMKAFYFIPQIISTISKIGLAYQR